VKGQIVEVERPRVIHLVFGVVSFGPKRTGPFSKVHIESSTHRYNICTVSLEDISIDIRTRLVDGVALQGLGRLTKLQVESNAISSFGCDVGIEGENEIGLIDAEDIAEDVVSANIIGATWWSVEVVFIIAIEHIVDCGSAGQRRRQDRRRGRGCYIT